MFPFLAFFPRASLLDQIAQQTRYLFTRVPRILETDAVLRKLSSDVRRAWLRYFARNASRKIMIRPVCFRTPRVSAEQYRGR